MILVDTCVWVDHLRLTPHVWFKLRSAAERGALGLPLVCREEDSRRG